MFCTVPRPFARDCAWADCQEVIQRTTEVVEGGCIEHTQQEVNDTTQNKFGRGTHVLFQEGTMLPHLYCCAGLLHNLTFIPTPCHDGCCQSFGPWCREDLGQEIGHVPFPGNLCLDERFLLHHAVQKAVLDSNVSRAMRELAFPSHVDGTLIVTVECGDANASAKVVLNDSTE